MAAVPLSDRSLGCAGTLRRSHQDNPRLRSFSARLRCLSALASAVAAARREALVISDATSYFTRPSPRSTFLCGSYDVGSLGRSTEEISPMTAAGRKLTAATPIWRRRGGGDRPFPACGNHRPGGGAGPLTIDRTRGSARCLYRAPASSFFAPRFRRGLFARVTRIAMKILTRNDLAR